jgi:hypothetical protein
MKDNSILGSEKMPYLLTLLFALAGWTVVHIVDRLSQSPIIEYSVCESRNDGHTVYELTIINISQRTLFKNLRFDWMMKDSAKAKFIDGKSFLFSFPPMLGDYTPQTLPRQVSFTLLDFQPHGKVSLRTETSGATECDLYVSFVSSEDNPNDIVAADGPLMLLRASPTTFILKYEFSILIISLVVWSVCIVLYFVNIRKRNQLFMHHRKGFYQP